MKTTITSQVNSVHHLAVLLFRLRVKADVKFWNHLWEPSVNTMFVSRMLHEMRKQL